MKVILIHGFHRTPRDMKPLKYNLQLLGYECIVPKLPLMFREFEHCVTLLDELLAELHLAKDEKVHFVGHSTGGLVIRQFLAHTKYIEHIGRCVLVASPNNGSKLADIVHQFKIWTKIYKTLGSIRTDYVKQLQLPDYYPVEVGAIAGTKNSVILENIINEPNDGRIEVSTVYFPGLTDYITLPYSHTEIHHKIETAELIDHFLRIGKFEMSNQKIEC